MRYSYEIYEKAKDQDSRRVDTGVRVELIQLKPNHFVRITDNLYPNKLIADIHTQDELDGWLEAAARAYTWSDAADKAKWNPLEESDGFHVKSSEVLSKGSIDLTLGQLKMEKDHINPNHYQAYITTESDVLQWLETMQYLPRYRRPESFCAAVELQIRKYLDRNGQKDEELQEFQKALWYMKFLVAYMKNGYKPIRVKDM